MKDYYNEPLKKSIETSQMVDDSIIDGMTTSFS